jgi:hypothetical protein
VKPSWSWLARAGLALLLVAVVFVGLALVRVAPIDVSGLSRRARERSALMKQREREARQKGRAYHESHEWVSLDRISPHLRDAVLVAEDARFFSHEGFDWNEIRESAKRNLRAKRVVRGGSTITQQLAKNLWLSTAQTPWRKFEEMILAVRLEHALSKRRILELYLNTIEWGEGVYGAEAASVTVRRECRLARRITGDPSGRGDHPRDGSRRWIPAAHRAPHPHHRVAAAPAWGVGESSSAWRWGCRPRRPHPPWTLVRSCGPRHDDPPGSFEPVPSPEPEPETPPGPPPLASFAVARASGPLTLLPPVTTPQAGLRPASWENLN